MNKTLNDNFLNELFRLFFLRKTLVERVHTHLKYQMLPSEHYKTIYKDIVSQVQLSNSTPTFGLLYEKHKDNEGVVDLLNVIKESDIVEPETLLKQLEKYIKDVRFQMLWEQVKKIHAEDEEKAIQTMAKESTEIVEFSLLKDNGNFMKVFADFQKNQLEKQINKEELSIKSKIPFGIIPCDMISQGGSDRKDTTLWILRSGVGKSTALKWQGMYACRLGFDVLHIQLEGSREEVFDKYTQIWTALSYVKVKWGNMEDAEYSKFLKIANEMVVLSQDVYVKSFEQFNEASMIDVRDAVVEYIKEKGKAPDLLVLDSIDLVHPGDGIHYGVDTQSIKMKLQNASRKFKNICNEFDMAGTTATQTSDVPLDIWNDPDKVITRSNSMGDKNIANSYSFVFTGNQTLDEEKRRTMRIYFDKIRYYHAGLRIFPIATNFEIGRYIDVVRTKKQFADIYS